MAKLESVTILDRESLVQLNMTGHQYRRWLREAYGTDFDLRRAAVPREGLVGWVLDQVFGVRERWEWVQVNPVEEIPTFNMPSSPDNLLPYTDQERETRVE